MSKVSKIQKAMRKVKLQKAIKKGRTVYTRKQCLSLFNITLAPSSKFGYWVDDVEFVEI
jgi:hypothetical protein